MWALLFDDRHSTIARLRHRADRLTGTSPQARTFIAYGPGTSMTNVSRWAIDAGKRFSPNGFVNSI